MKENKKETAQNNEQSRIDINKYSWGKTSIKDSDLNPNGTLPAQRIYH